MPLKKIKTIRSTHFFKYWNQAKMTEAPTDCDVLSFFKPCIDNLATTALGNHYWQIYSLDDPKILYAGGNVEGLTPYTKQQLIGMDPISLFSIFCPADIEQVYALIKKFTTILLQAPVEDRKHYSNTLYCRVKAANNTYIWNSLQYPSFYYSKTGKILFGMAVYTDVSHVVKKDMKPMLTIFNSLRQTTDVFTCYQEKDKTQHVKTYPAMTRREKEIFDLLIKGKASKEIAATLQIAKSTVDNQRYGLLKKFNAVCTAELISKVTAIEILLR